MLLYIYVIWWIPMRDISRLSEQDVVSLSPSRMVRRRERDDDLGRAQLRR